MKYYVGIDIGGMSIKAGLVDACGNILVKESVTTPLNDKNLLKEAIFKLIDNVLKKSEKTISEIEYVGIGSPGIVNFRTGEVLYASNLGIEKFDICKQVTAKYDVDCYVENDANCAVLGEYYFGDAVGFKDVIMVTLGTGVGTGMLINGKVLVSPGGGGTEGGHMCIVNGGLDCACGAKGCYEKYASASALISQTESAMKEHKDSLLLKYAMQEGEVNGKVAFLAARENDEVAKQVLAKYVEYVGTGIVNIVNIFRPDLILIGGGVSNEKEMLIKPVEEYVNSHMFGKDYLEKIPVRQAKLKNDAGILGAAMLGQNKEG